MSSDTYYIIRRHPNGGFTPVLNFASEDYERSAESRHRQFASQESALESAKRDPYVDYEIETHAECDLDQNSYAFIEAPIGASGVELQRARREGEAQGWEFVSQNPFTGALSFTTSRQASADAARMVATVRLAFAREQHPAFSRAEAEARLQLGAAIMAMDEATDSGSDIGEQVEVERALRAYGHALADLIRGETEGVLQ